MASDVPSNWSVRTDDPAVLSEFISCFLKLPHDAEVQAFVSLIEALPPGARVSRILESMRRDAVARFADNRSLLLRVIFPRNPLMGVAVDLNSRALREGFCVVAPYLINFEIWTSGGLVMGSSAPPNEIWVQASTRSLNQLRSGNPLLENVELESI